MPWFDRRRKREAHRLPLVTIALAYLCYGMFASEATVTLFALCSSIIFITVIRWKAVFWRAGSLAMAMCVAITRSLTVFERSPGEAVAWLLVAVLEYYAWPHLLPPRLEPGDFL